MSPQTAAPSSDVAGRSGRDVCLQVAVEGGCGPEGVSWVPEHHDLVLGSPPAGLLTCWAVEQSAHTHSFGIYIWGSLFLGFRP